jgi:hypothetical protein
MNTFQPFQCTAYDSLVNIIYRIISVPYSAHSTPWTCRHKRMTGTVNGVMWSPKWFLTFCLPLRPILPANESKILETPIYGISIIHMGTVKSFPTSFFCIRVQWCYSWPAHCIPHLPKSDRWHLCQHFVTWTVNPLRKCSSTNMMSGVLSELHHTNECHGSAQSYPLQWPEKKCKKCVGLQESHSFCSHGKHTKINPANSQS